MSSPLWRYGVWGSAVLLSLGLGLVWYGVRLNTHPSVPLGFYLLRPLPPVLHRGMLVHLRTPTSVTYWTSARQLTKPIAAFAGENMCVDRDGNLVGPQGAYGPIFREAGGRPLPHLVRCMTVPAGQVFLASTMLGSLDSRYFGPVPLTALLGVATPLWVWKE